MAAMPKDFKKIVKAAEQRGWVFSTAKKHYQLRHPEHGLVTFSKSPSCPYAMHNIVADIKRKEGS